MNKGEKIESLKLYLEIFKEMYKIEKINKEDYFVVLTCLKKDITKIISEES